MASDPAVLAEIARLSGLINRHRMGLPVDDIGSQAAAVPTYSHYSSRGARGRGQQPHQHQYQQVRGRGRGTRGTAYPTAVVGVRGSSRARADAGRGRGQPLRRNNVWTPPPTTATAGTSTSAAATVLEGKEQALHKSVHRKLGFNGSGSGSASSSSARASPAPVPAYGADGAATQGNGGQAEASTSASASTGSTKEQLEIQRDGQDTKASTHGSSVAATSTTAVDEQEEGEIEQTLEERKNAKIHPGREIVINGVTFIADAKGKKLVRKDSGLLSAASTQTTSAAQSTQTLTPSKTNIGGEAYVRTKSGNLISASLVKKRELEAKKKRLDQLVGVIKSVQGARGRQAAASKKLQAQQKTPCRFFQKTGVCIKGLTCPYLHDPAKVSVCPRFLRNSCPLPSSACPLSHIPDVHRMPHCLHFPYCNKGTACLYTHVHVSPAAKVCKDFVTLGWCERGLECKERHVWECPDFSESGKCSKRGCKLPHVIRRSGGTSGADTARTGEDAKTVAAKEGAQAGGADIGHSLPYAGDKGKKRAHPAPSDSGSEEDSDEASSDEVEQTLLSRFAGRKKQKITFNPDAVEANEDFVTLIISDSDEEDQDEEEEADEETDSEGDDDEHSSVESHHDEEGTNERDRLDENPPTPLEEVDDFMNGITQSLTTADRFKRRGSSSADE